MQIIELPKTGVYKNNSKEKQSIVDYKNGFRHGIVYGAVIGIISFQISLWIFKIIILY